MWERMSGASEVRTATTPGGTSSSPVTADATSTVGSVKVVSCTSLMFATTIFPTVPAAGPGETICHTGMCPSARKTEAALASTSEAGAAVPPRSTLRRRSSSQRWCAGAGARARAPRRNPERGWRIGINARSAAPRGAGGVAAWRAETSSVKSATLHASGVRSGFFCLIAAPTVSAVGCNSCSRHRRMSSQGPAPARRRPAHATAGIKPPHVPGGVRQMRDLEEMRHSAG